MIAITRESLPRLILQQDGLDFYVIDAATRKVIFTTMNEAIARICILGTVIYPELTLMCNPRSPAGIPITQIVARAGIAIEYEPWTAPLPDLRGPQPLPVKSPQRFEEV